MFAGETVGLVELVALLVCLIPTTIGGLLSAIGIAGMDRVARFNVLAMSGRAVEAAGDVDVILLDKTGTITFGNRLASRIVPAPGRVGGRVVTAALLASLGDETPEGRSVVDARPAPSVGARCACRVRRCRRPRAAPRHGHGGPSVQRRDAGPAA